MSNNNRSFKDSAPVSMLITFVNQLFLKLIKLTPDNLKIDIEREINQVIDKFLQSNPSFIQTSDDYIAFNQKVDHDIPREVIIQPLQNMIHELVSKIDQLHANWGHALMKDAIESILIDLENIPHIVTSFVKTMGINAVEFKDSLKSAVPTLDEKEKIIFVAYMTLTDFGPVMKRVVSTDETIIDGIDNNIAAQIITLVGQGVSYHEGIFGPIPIPTSNDIISLIWSKLIDSDIKDDRMRGKSLTVIAIGFYRNLITRLPQRNKMKEIFSVLDKIHHVNDITDEVLERIQDEFIMNI